MSDPPTGASGCVKWQQVFIVAFVVGGLGVAAWYASTRRRGDAIRAAAVSSGSASANSKHAEESFLRLQQQLVVANECDAVLHQTIAFQGPVVVRVAWQQPDFAFIHVHQFGNNPQTWYWYERGTLCVYEEWPGRGCRGIRINNVVRVAAGDAARAFGLVLRKAEAFVHVGHTGLQALDLLKAVRTGKLQISEGEREWQFRAAEDSFASEEIQPFRSGTDQRALVTFTLPKTPGTPSGVSRISVEYASADAGHNVPPEAGVLTQVRELRFTLDRQRLEFPRPPPGALTPVELQSPDDLRPDLIDRLPLLPVPDR